MPPGSDAWVLAMKLFAPCFISGWSAAEHWDLTEQTFNATAVVSGRQQRRSKQAVGGATFRVRTLPEGRIFGATRIWIGSNAVQMADQHRLLIDILDDPSFGGGGRHTLDVVRSYWSGGSANPDKLLDHAIQFGRGTVFKRMGFSAELFGKPSPEWLAECSSHMTAGVSRLDPGGPDKGRIVSKWRLRVNVPMVTE